MALTPAKSSQYTDFTALPGVSVHGAEWDAKSRKYVGKLTYTVAGTGEAKMIRLPAGRKLIFPDTSRMVSPAGSAGATMSVGHSAYTKPDGTAVAADTAAFANAVVITSAIDQALPLPAAPYLVIDSKEGVDVTINIATANSPAAGDAYVVLDVATAR